jgi:hypothetical protein
MRTSDRHAMLLDHVQFYGVLVELSKLWSGIPMQGNTRYLTHEWKYIDGRDEALRAYAVRLSHGFPTERQGARRR